MSRAIFAVKRNVIKPFVVFKSFDSKKGSLPHIFSALIFLGSLLAGTIVLQYTSSDFLRYIGTLTENHIVSLCNSKALQIAIKSSAIRALSIIFCCIMANCSLGLPFIAAHIAFSGFGLGLVSGFYYYEFGFKGFWINLLLVTMPGIVYAIAVVLLATDAFNLSWQYFRTAFLRHSGNIDLYEDKFISRLPRIAMLIIFSGLLEGILYDLFGSLVI